MAGTSNVVHEMETNEPEVEEIELTPENRGKRKPHFKVDRKKRSKVWTLFEPMPKSEGEKESAKCKKCGKVYVSDSTYGTGNLLSHMNKCLKAKDVGQLLLSKSANSLLGKSIKFDPEVFRELLIEAIIKHNLPFTFVEYEGIRAIFTYISEDIKLPSRNTAKSGVLKLFKREKLKLHELLKSVTGRICLTSDLWTSVTTDGYLTLTAHFVDEQWRLNKKIINFCVMPPPHTGVALSEKIYTLLSEWEIEKKLLSITLDNASSNTSFVEILKSQLNLKDALIMNGEFFHIRCCAHILNLIVQDGLKEIDEAIFKVRESVKYIKGSAGRKYKFYDCVSQVSIECKKGLRQDVPTRWNSTYIMLESAIYYRRAFIHLRLSDSNYKFCPSEDEWVKIKKIAKFLKLFYEVACLFSGSKYPTANLFFPQIFMIQHNIKESMNGKDNFMRKMADQMNLKFEKYWAEYSVVLAIAVILDPRFKMKFVEWAYVRLYGADSFEFARVNDTMLKLFELYSVKYSHLIKQSTSSDSRGGSTDRDNSLFMDFDNCYKEESFGVTKTELRKYLDEELLDRKSDIDILYWWMGERIRYPILSNLARDILSIPVSTVASESSFSIGGRVLDQYRSSLLPDTVQALLCTKDWIFGRSGFEEPLNDIEVLTEDVFNLHINSEGFKNDQGSNALPLDAENEE